MKTEEFIPGDNECFDMVKRNRACHPGGEPMILMNRQQAMALMLKADRKNPRPDPEAPTLTREQLILQLAHGLIPVTIGLTWVLGACEGLADPAFASIVTGICILWGCVNWKWGKVHA